MFILYFNFWELWLVINPNREKWFIWDTILVGAN